MKCRISGRKKMVLKSIEIPEVRAYVKKTADIRRLY